MIVTSLFFLTLNVRTCISFLITPSQKSTTRIRAEPNLRDIQTSETLILPIFPLRQAVKLPTEAITLNLYEERYLELSEYVISSNEQIFGGLYCSQKAQILKNGISPIVPIVEVGDVGVICKVVYHAEAMIPTVEGSMRRRIKLEALAVGRFRIDRVIHNGYGNSFIGEETACPFILAKVSRIDDVPPSEEEILLMSKLETKLFNRVKDQEGFALDRVNWNLDNTDDKDEVIQAPLTPSLFSPGVIYGKQDKMSTYNEAICSWERVETHLDNHRRQQLFSFAMVSLVSMNKPASEILHTLECLSTYERLQYVDMNLMNGWAFWKTASSSIQSLLK